MILGYESLPRISKGCEPMPQKMNAELKGAIESLQEMLPFLASMKEIDLGFDDREEDDFGKDADHVASWLSDLSEKLEHVINGKLR